MADELHAFGAFVFDAGRKQLLKHGQPVAIGKRGLSLLAVLLAHRGRTVPKSILMDAVWPSTSVEESNLSVQIASLRRTLGPSRSGEDWIATIQGVGYLFQNSGHERHEPALPPPVATHGERPSIAVLPFANMSADAGQEYLADGFVEEITTALSRLRQLFVVARSSSFTYKGRAVDVRQIGHELGVRYVLQGSFRRAGGSVRVVGQLIECATGTHLWAERFDGDASAIFQLQDDVAAKVAGAIVPRLESAEIRRVAGKPTSDLGAYDWYLRGMAAFHKFTRQANGEALALFRTAIDHDGEFALAHGMAARCYMQRLRNGWAEDPPLELAEAHRMAQRAEELGKGDPDVLGSIGLVFAALMGEFEHGAALTDLALRLNPNSAWAWLSSSFIRIYLGEPKLAIEHADLAMRLSPQDPQRFAMLTAKALGYFFEPRNDEAMLYAKAALIERPTFFAALCASAASHAHAGNISQSQSAVARLRMIQPGITCSSVKGVIPLRRAEDIDRWETGLMMAGLEK